MEYTVYFNVFLFFIDWLFQQYVGVYLAVLALYPGWIKKITFNMFLVFKLSMNRINTFLMFYVYIQFVMLNYTNRISETR